MKLRVILSMVMVVIAAVIFVVGFDRTPPENNPWSNDRPIAVGPVRPVLIFARGSFRGRFIGLDGQEFVLPDLANLDIEYLYTFSGDPYAFGGLYSDSNYKLRAFFAQRIAPGGYAVRSIAMPSGTLSTGRTDSVFLEGNLYYSNNNALVRAEPSGAVTTLTRELSSSSGVAAIDNRLFLVRSDGQLCFWDTSLSTLTPIGYEVPLSGIIAGAEGDTLYLIGTSTSIESIARTPSLLRIGSDANDRPKFLDRRNAPMDLRLNSNLFPLQFVTTLPQSILDDPTTNRDGLPMDGGKHIGSIAVLRVHDLGLTRIYSPRGKMIADLPRNYLVGAAWIDTSIEANDTP